MANNKEKVIFNEFNNANKPYVVGHWTRRSRNWPSTPPARTRKIASATDGRTRTPRPTRPGRMRPPRPLLRTISAEPANIRYHRMSVIWKTYLMQSWTDCWASWSTWKTCSCACTRKRTRTRSRSTSTSSNCSARASCS